MSGIPVGSPVFIAVDLGASSGRIILGRVTDSGPELETVHRFPNGVRRIAGALRWDFDGLIEQVLEGLSLAAARTRERGERVLSIGIDTWGLDYGLVDRAGKLVSVPFSYRDERSNQAVARVHQAVGPAALYSITGIQYLPCNTIYQLASEDTLQGLQALLIPDLIAYRLTGQRRTEATNASTTGLFDAAAGEWAAGLFTSLGLPSGLFPPLIQAGERVGGLLPSVAARTRLDEAISVVAVGSHDTASAVVAVPAQEPDFAYISSGTWSLVGVELDAPVLTEASRAANFTNERGVDGTIRYLRNIGGLWLLQESQRAWAEEGLELDLAQLLEEAAELPPDGPRINADDPAFIPPGNMPARIRASVQEAGGQLPTDRPAAIVRCILDSLADGYAETIENAARLSGKTVKRIHVVGGGSQNALLCQLTANATGLPVTAGPVEATALGNVLIQARTAGIIKGDLPQLRQMAFRTLQTTVGRGADRDLTHHRAASSYLPEGEPVKAWRVPHEG
ncbi:rhamnulokinase [Sinomonas atrocyanea]